MDFCCLTEAEVQQLIENIYELCDCCETDIFNDDLDTALDLDALEDFYD